MRIRLLVLLSLCIGLGFPAGPAHAQDPEPQQTLPNGALSAEQASPDPAPVGADGGWHVGRPRAAILSVFDGAAESFLRLGDSSDQDPVHAPIGPDGGGLLLHADFEVVLLPLTAGWARAELAAWLIRDGERVLLDDDSAEVVAFGPARRGQRLQLAPKLEPGLHRLELVLVTEARAVGVAERTRDQDTATVWVFVGGDRAQITAAADDPSLARGGTYVGAQRGAAGPTAAGAVNFETGDGSVVRAVVGHPVDLWTGYELWWAESASGDGRAALVVSHRDQSSATGAEIGRAVQEPAGQGPHLAKGNLRVALTFDAPGEYHILARLATRIRSGDIVHQDEDSVALTVVVYPDPRLGAIAGRVTADLGPTPAGTVPIVPLEGIRIVASSSDGALIVETRSDAQGWYRLDGLIPGRYFVHADPGEMNFLGEWYDDQPARRAADPVTVEAASTTSPVSFALTPGATLLGRVTGPRGEALSGIEIVAGLATDAADPAAPRPAPSGGALVAGGWRTRSNDEGYYSLSQLPAGAYWVRASDPEGRFLTEYYDDQPDASSAHLVRLTVGATAKGIDFVLEPGGAIAGHVLEETPLAVVLPLGEIVVTAMHPDRPNAVAGRAVTNREGKYRIGGLPATRYLVKASDPTGTFLAEWFEEADAMSDAEPVVVHPGQTTGAIDFTLARSSREAEVFIHPPVLGLTPGGSGKLAIAVRNVRNLGAFEIELKWNTDVFTVTDVTLGDFLGSSGRHVIPVEPEVDNVAGSLRFGAASVGDAPGPDGEGALFHIGLAAVSTGSTDVTVADGILTDPSGREIPFTRSGGSVAVGACMRGDFDCNCVIDIRDLMAVVLRWGSVEGDPDYDPLFDLDSDADIDIVDVQIEAALWGTVCPVEAGAAPHASLSAAGRATAERDQPGQSLAGPHGVRLHLAQAPGSEGEFRLGIGLSEAREVAAIDAEIAFDPEAVEVVDVQLGDELAASGRTYVPLGPQPVGSGRVRVGAYSFPGHPAVTSMGPLIWVTLRPLADGATDITARDAWIVSAAGESAPAGPTTVDLLPATAARPIYLPRLESW